MITPIEAKRSIEAFDMCFKEAKKIKGLEGYQKYHLALEMAKILAGNSQKEDFIKYLIEDSSMFDSFGHQIGLALKDCFPQDFDIDVNNVSDLWSEG